MASTDHPAPPRETGSGKRERQNTILELISAHVIGSQEDLRRLLLERGLQITQATLSRDLRELGVVRAQTDEGLRYLLPERLADESKLSLEALLPELFSRIDGVSELLVIHTLPSGAQPIAEAVDAKGWSEILGTIAGENTVLIICRSAEARQALTDRLLRLANRA